MCAVEKYKNPLSALTVCAVERRALAKDDRTDRRAANLAWLASAAVDKEFLLEIAGHAVGTQKIAQGCAAARDRIGEDAFDLERKTAVSRPRHRTGRAARMDTGSE